MTYLLGNLVHLCYGGNKLMVRNIARTCGGMVNSCSWCSLKITVSSRTVIVVLL